MKERCPRHWKELMLPSKYRQRFYFHNADKYHLDLIKQHKYYRCRTTSLHLFSVHNQQDLYPGTKNEILVETERIKGNSGICFKTEQKKFA